MGEIKGCREGWGRNWILAGRRAQSRRVGTGRWMVGGLLNWEGRSAKFFRTENQASSNAGHVTALLLGGSATRKVGGWGMMETRVIIMDTGKRRDAGLVIRH